MPVKPEPPDFGAFHALNTFYPTRAEPCNLATSNGEPGQIDFSNGAVLWYATTAWSVVQPSPGHYAYRGDLAGDALAVKSDATIGFSWKLDVDVDYQKYYANNGTRGVASIGTFMGVDFGVQLLATAEMFSNGSVGITIAWWNPASHTWNTVLDTGYLSGATSACHLQFVRQLGSNTLTFSVRSTATSSNFTLSGSAQAGNYFVVANNSFGSVTSTVATIRLLVSLAITSQPQSETVIIGDPVTFSVIATGTQPLTYQWLKNGLSITGATNASYTITNAQPVQAAAYSVSVTPSLGSKITILPAGEQCVRFGEQRWSGRRGFPGQLRETRFDPDRCASSLKDIRTSWNELSHRVRLKSGRCQLATIGDPFFTRRSFYLR